MSLIVMIAGALGAAMLASMSMVGVVNAATILRVMLPNHQRLRNALCYSWCIAAMGLGLMVLEVLR